MSLVPTLFSDHPEAVVRVVQVEGVLLRPHAVLPERLAERRVDRRGELALLLRPPWKGESLERQKNASTVWLHASEMNMNLLVNINLNISAVFRLLSILIARSFFSLRAADPRRNLKNNENVYLLVRKTHFIPRVHDTSLFFSFTDATSFAWSSKKKAVAKCVPIYLRLEKVFLGLIELTLLQSRPSHFFFAQRCFEKRFHRSYHLARET